MEFYSFWKQLLIRVIINLYQQHFCMFRSPMVTVNTIKGHAIEDTHRSAFTCTKHVTCHVTETPLLENHGVLLIL